MQKELIEGRNLPYKLLYDHQYDGLNYNVLFRLFVVEIQIPPELLQFFSFPVPR